MITQKQRHKINRFRGAFDSLLRIYEDEREIHLNKEDYQDIKAIFEDFQEAIVEVIPSLNPKKN